MSISKFKVGLGAVFIGACLTQLYNTMSQRAVRESELAEDIAVDSVLSCQINVSNQYQDDYYNRVLTPLSKMKLKYLERIVKNDITICLDGRLPVSPQADKLADGEEIIGVYDPKKRLLTVWDTGLPDDPNDIRTTSRKQAYALSGFSHNIKYKLPREFLYAGIYKCGFPHMPRTCIFWEPENKHNIQTIKQNSQLNTAPLKSL